VTLILYGIATESSIGQLFLGGVVPGIMVTLLFCVWIFIAMTLIRSNRNPSLVSNVIQSSEEEVRSPQTAQSSPEVVEAEEASWKRRITILVKVVPFVVLIAAILGALYLGVATPSEAAAVGALLALILVGVLYGMRPGNIMNVALETTRTSTMILMIVAFSAVLGQVLSFLNVPQDLAGLIADLNVNRWVIFFAMNVLFLVLGFFVPPVAIILITMPVLFPIITELGFDPIWFGIVMTLNMEMGLITPPVGLNLYVVQGIAPDMPVRDILLGSLPYVAVLAIGIVILCLFPGIVTWLPNQMLG
jgi:C4-dicarboxylate transporter, DctM subunit